MPVPTGGGRRKPSAAVLGLVPFFAYTSVFLVLPTVSVVVGAFTDSAGRFTLGNLSAALQEPYLTALLTSLKLSLVTAVLGVLLGALLANAVVTSPRAVLLRHVVSSASGVFAHLGGVPLAFMFIASIGSIGLVTRALQAIGLDLYATGFSLFSFAGIVVVYVYFQVPLMVLVITPALEGLRPQWAEAAHNLGATRPQYWRYVAGPVLLPALLGSLLLLFANSFAAYATAAALTNGGVPLLPIEIGSLLSGNVIAGQENLGKALGLEMIVIVAALMGGYTLLQRRASRWLS